MGVIVGIAKLVGDGVEKEISSLGVEFKGEALKQFKRRRLGGVLVQSGGGRSSRSSSRGSRSRRRGRGRRIAIVGAVDGKVSSVKDEGVDERDVETSTCNGGFTGGKEKTRDEIGDDLRTILKKEIEISLKGFESHHEIGTNVWCFFDLGQDVDLEVGSKGIRESHVARKGRENEISHLDARDWNNVAKGKVIVAEKVGKVMKEDEKDAKCSHVKKFDGFDEFCVSKIRLEEFKERNKEQMIDMLTVEILCPRQ